VISSYVHLRAPLGLVIQRVRGLNDGELVEGLWLHHRLRQPPHLTHQLLVRCVVGLNVQLAKVVAAAPTKEGLTQLGHIRGGLPPQIDGTDGLEAGEGLAVLGGRGQQALLDAQESGVHIEVLQVLARLHPAAKTALHVL